MTSRLGLVLTGGGARAAYQVGFLQALAEHHADLEPDILTGVSAGAINAAFLAACPGSFREATEKLSDLWESLSPEQVYRVDAPALIHGAVRWFLRLASGGSRFAPRVRGLVDTAPLRRFLLGALKPDARGELPGIEQRFDRGRLRALALSTVDYGSGHTVVWVQGRGVEMWQRPRRHSRAARLAVDHILASSALPLLFPAVQLDGSWHGDGGIRLATPLSPAIHLGADRIVALSTRYRGGAPAHVELPHYPPPAQVASILLNAIFLDMLDHDALRLQSINHLLHGRTDAETGLRPIRLEVFRPSRDLGRLAGEYESRLPRAFRFLTRGLGTREARSPDLLSLLMFQPDYVSRLIEIGREDAAAERERVARLIDADGG